jgi:xanthine dehydrogenase YagT iron-sulfur-binding subunit
VPLVHARLLSDLVIVTVFPLRPRANRDPPPSAQDWSGAAWGQRRVDVSSEVPILVDVALRVNGDRRDVRIDSRTSLLDLLREHLDLTGAKNGCAHGQCGACTVLVDGRRTNACLTLAVTLDGAEVVTVEGLADGDALHPLQQAFIEHDAFQCGYCTPGQLCSAVGMLGEVEAGWPSAVTAESAELTGDEIRERMNGNLCRCGAYVNLVPAILEAGR